MALVDTQNRSFDQDFKYGKLWNVVNSKDVLYSVALTQ